MNDGPEVSLEIQLAPIPIAPAAARRIRARVAQEVETRRQEMLEGALYGGFALAAVAWALLITLPH